VLGPCEKRRAAKLSSPHFQVFWKMHQAKPRAFCVW